MYDSVYPTRTARFGVALVSSGMLKLKNMTYAEDLRYVHNCMIRLANPGKAVQDVLHDIKLRRPAVLCLNFN